MDLASLKYSSTSLWLYGSHARGDPDRESDLDVLAAADNPISNEDFVKITGRSGLQRLAISRYSWPEIEGMASYGSLFLHHLRLEGKCLFEGLHSSGRLQSILGSLGPYKHACQDVRAFHVTVNDVRSSLNGGGSLFFELSVLATVLRHASILGCYLSNEPTFGRATPVRRLVDLWHLNPSTPDLFKRLYRYRLWSDQRSEKPTEISLTEAMDWCNRIESILMELEDRAHEYEGELSRAANIG